MLTVQQGCEQSLPNSSACGCTDFDNADVTVRVPDRNLLTMSALPTLASANSVPHRDAPPPG